MDPEQLVVADLTPSLPHASTVPSRSEHNDDTLDQESTDPDDELLSMHGSFSTLRVLSTERAPPSPQQLSQITPTQHYATLIASCTCVPSCDTAALQAASTAFATFDEAERVAYMRSMLFAIAAPATEQNDILVYSRSVEEKKRRRLSAGATGRTTSAYAIKGRRVCKMAFAAALNLSERTVERHARLVAHSKAPSVYTSNRNVSRKGKVGVQKVVVLAFLNQFASNHAMECPRGRGSSDETPLRLLDSEYTRVSVYDSYCEQWKTIVDGLLSMELSITMPPTPLSYNLFIRYWTETTPTLRIAASGSDFCDTCSTIRHTLSQLSPTDVRFDANQRYLNEHREMARTEFAYYRSLQSKARENPSQDDKHIVFDFAEKVLLPHLQKQPGQLHFVTGLKFDLFGVACSNLDRVFVFGLPEGHWPNEKTANVVMSMLHYVLHNLRSSEKPTASSRRLVLHTDNCSGQNKNRFLLWYFAWRVIVGLEEYVALNFLIAGHTKNVCDGAFGHVKRKFRTSNVHTPGEMMTVIEGSSKKTSCIPATEVCWIDWKDTLSEYFTIPTGLKISANHSFEFHSGSPGNVITKKLSTSTTSTTFFLVKRSKTLIEIMQQNEQDLQQTKHRSTIPSLHLVPSPKNLTRLNYLKVNILQRYYPLDEGMEMRYFSSGIDELMEHLEAAAVLNE